MGEVDHQPPGIPKVSIFLISLAGAHERRKRSEERLQTLGLPYEIAVAADGEALTTQEMSAWYDTNANARKFKRPLSRPEIGCYISHFRIWETVAESGVPALILEDDFDAPASLTELLDDIMSRLPPKAIVKLNCEARLFLGSRGLALPYRLVRPFVGPPLTIGYLLMPDAARALAKQAVPFSRPVDMDIKHWWEFGVNLLAVYPSVITQRAGQIDSSLERARSSKKGTPFQRLRRNLIYQAAFIRRLSVATLRSLGSDVIGRQ